MPMQTATTTAPDLKMRIPPLGIDEIVSNLMAQTPFAITGQHGQGTAKSFKYTDNKWAVLLSYDNGRVALGYGESINPTESAKDAYRSAMTQNPKRALGQDLKLDISDASGYGT
jgi:hypothetical protein